MVVTIFSISELACASSMGRILINISWFGIRFAMAFRPARDALAVMHAFRIAFVSMSALGGSRAKC